MVDVGHVTLILILIGPGLRVPSEGPAGVGSCWAFAATAMIESYAHINTGNCTIASPEMKQICFRNESNPNILYINKSKHCIVFIMALMVS